VLPVVLGMESECCILDGSAGIGLRNGSIVLEERLHPVFVCRCLQVFLRTCGLPACKEGNATTGREPKMVPVLHHGAQPI